jgi:mono/diheme cytochrome c family protein
MPPLPAPGLSEKKLAALTTWIAELPAEAANGSVASKDLTAAPGGGAPEAPPASGSTPPAGGGASAVNPALATAAMDVLKTACASCHAPGGLAVGGVTDINNVEYLIANKHIVPGKPAESRLVIRAKDTVNPMPPPPAALLGAAQVKALEDWIVDLANGAPTGSAGSEAGALKLLADRCASCHGANGVGGLSNITDKAALVQSGAIVPGKPEASSVFLRSQNAANPMPPAPAPLLNAAELKLLSDWIVALGATPPPPPRRFVNLTEEFKLALDDLETIEAQSRQEARNTRYVSFVHLFNAGQSDIKLKEHANSLSRTLNHLSDRAAIAKPKAINPEGTLFRINIRDYGWSDNDWNRVTEDYAYRDLFPDGSTREQFRDITGTTVVLVRGDWFALHMTQPSSYNELLDIPNNLRGAEREFNFDLFDNIEREAAGNGGGVVMRSGFMKSGVSLSNRVFERHEIDNGAFWISYDFEKVQLEEDDSQGVRRFNIFAAPLGPRFADGNNPIRGAGEFGFDHTAGEVIATLPNGLFYYMLITNNGTRADNAPTSIVSDPTRPEGIINGYSCMNCHANGLLQKDDEIRANMANLTGLSDRQREAVENLYVPKETMDKAMAGDNKRYRQAIADASLDPTVASPSILSLAQSYEAWVTPATAAAELGLTVAELKKLIEDRVSRNMQNQLSPLMTGSGQMARSLYEPIVGDMLQEVLGGGRRRNRN